MLVKDGEQVKAGKVLAMWDATSRPIITEYAGRVKFENVEEGVTVAKQVDDVTGLSTLVVIDPKRRAGAAAKGVRPQVKLLECERRGSEAGDRRSVRQHHLPARFHHHREGRPGRDGRRSAGADPAGNVEDARHHGRSAARRRTVRGAFAEGRGSAGGSHGHGVVRQGYEGQAASGHHRPGRRAERVPDPEGQARHGARWPGGEQGRSRSSTDPPTRTTSCVCWASRRWRVTSRTKCRTCIACRA